jgi:hypothetical protein
VTRSEAIDVLWAAIILALPVGADMPNSEDDRAFAELALAGSVKALARLGVTIEELGAAQSRYEATLASDRSARG